MTKGIKRRCAPLASQQEIYLTEHHTYASVLADLDILLSDNVTVSINEAAGTDWAATGTHSGLTTHCGFFFFFFFASASASNATPATTPGTVTCD